MALNTITKTAGDIATYVKRQFGDESAVQITDVDIFRWIDAAQTEITSKVAPVKAKATTDVVANQEIYDMAALPIHQIESIHYNGNFLLNKSFAEAERLVYTSDPNIKQTGNPDFWYEWAGQVYLFPIPALDIVGGLDIYFTKEPIPIILGTTLLSVPDKYFEAITSWVLHKAFQLDEEFAESANQKQFFEATLNEQNQEERTSQNMTYPTITYIGD